MNESFALFLFDESESAGGADDLCMIGSLADCMSRAEASDHFALAQIADMQTLAVIKRGRWDYTPLHEITGLESDRGKIDWKYQWSDND